MSRGVDRGGERGAGFPRVSGDEPWERFCVVDVEGFSPRERG